MKHLTDQERDFLVKITESIEDVIAANSGILKTLDRLGSPDIVTAALPFTATITAKLQGMVTEIHNYAQVTELDIHS
jgi:hypothetical protein